MIPPLADALSDPALAADNQAADAALAVKDTVTVDESVAAMIRKFEAENKLPNVDKAVLENMDALHESDFRHPVHVLKVGAQGGRQFRQWVRDRWPEFLDENIKMDSWLGFTNPDSMEVPQVPCGRWWELNIMSDGTCAHCCMDATGEHSIGNVRDHTMLEVYNAPLWRDRREKMMERKDVPLCNTCSY